MLHHPQAGLDVIKTAISIFSNTMLYYNKVSPIRHNIMGAIKKTISIDENVAKEAGEISTNFSAIVEEALVEYIQHHRIKKAIQSFGKWGERDGSSTDIVNDLRRKDDRPCVTSNNPTKKG